MNTYRIHPSDWEVKDIPLSPYEIKKKYFQGYTQRELSLFYNISLAHVTKILNTL